MRVGSLASRLALRDEELQDRLRLLVFCGTSLGIHYLAWLCSRISNQM